MKYKKVYMRNTLLSAMFLSIGIILPFFTGQIKEIGDTLLPMHIPVMLCGLICGGKYGFIIGFILPFLRSVIGGMPPLYPNALWMAAELSVYGLSIGFLYNKFPERKTRWVYCSLISSMILGRVVWGIVKASLLEVADKTFTIGAFIAGGFIDSFPGIALQLILIPIIMKIIESHSERK